MTSTDSLIYLVRHYWMSYWKRSLIQFRLGFDECSADMWKCVEFVHLAVCCWGVAISVCRWWSSCNNNNINVFSIICSNIVDDLTRCRRCSFNSSYPTPSQQCECYYGFALHISRSHPLVTMRMRCLWGSHSTPNTGPNGLWYLFIDYIDGLQLPQCRSQLLSELC